MISAGDFRKGVTFEMNGEPHVVLDFQHVKPGKGAAFVRTKYRNILTGATREEAFNPNDKFPKAHIETKTMQYLYNDGELYYFMDQETFDQVPLSADLVEDAVKFIRENDTATIKFYQGNAFAVEAPNFVDLKVIETEPGVKGDTATNVTKAATVEKLLKEIQGMVLEIVNRVIVPVLPFFIATTFTELAYSGSLTRQLPVFLKVIIIVLIGHFIWMTLLYLIGGAVSKKNPLEVVKHYGPAYATAVGTMSSAATLPVALQCAHKSSVLPSDIVDFAIPLGATTHLCGSVLTETFFAMTISQMLYGTVPPIGTMILFSFLFGVFAVGAPGVPGGTVMASLGIVISVLGFDEIGTGLLIAIFALQDSFGTACNVTGDGALALILRGLFYKPDGTAKQA